MKKLKSNDATAVLGPVDSLESYVKSEWWKEIFNANYLRTDGDVVNDTLITNQEVELFIKALGLQKDHNLLDLCCGQGRHTIGLYQKGYHNVNGLDRSHYLIVQARKTAKKESYNVQFKEGDARKLSFPTDAFDVVIIPGNSFGYFETAEDDLKVLNEVKRVLKPNGKLLLDITDGEFIKKNFERRSWEWIDKNNYVCRERSISADGERLVSREVIAHVKKGVLADQFYAERLYTEGRIRQLLNECNFSNIILHDNLVVQSIRNQDLGMMANRMIITAEIHKSWTARKTLKTAAKSVYVVMGDPKLNDTVKPNGTFDDDDYFTINELKRALGENKDYKIKYIDDHKTLIPALTSQKSKIDLIFNLCDEGFNNEAKKELHVPALFEMLEIPYTGGNPQCLAYCYDKSLVRGVAAEMDIPVPQAYIIKPEDTTFMDFPLTFPVIVKPNLGDSSIGINQNSVCNDILQLEKAILHVRSTTGFDSNILIEEFLPGKDISVGIIGNMPNDYTVLPIIEEDYSDLPADLPKICGYEAKWDSESPYWKIKSIRADLPEATVQFLINSCIKLFSRLNCRDYARFDWRIDKNGTPRLLEVNPNPGWCWDGHLAKMCKIADISYPEMLNMIIKSAEQRYSTCPTENA